MWNMAKQLLNKYVWIGYFHIKTIVFKVNFYSKTYLVFIWKKISFKAFLKIQKVIEC